MAKCDGEIRVNTAIKTKEAEQKLLNLQNHMLKTSQKIDSIAKKMEELKNAKVENTTEWKKLQQRMDEAKARVQSLKDKVKEMESTDLPTEEYTEIQNHLQAAEKEFDGLLAKQEKMQALGQDKGNAWKSLQYDMEQLGNAIEADRVDLQNLIDEGKAFTAQKGTDAYKQVKKDLAAARKEVRELKAEAEGMTATFESDKTTGIDRMNSDLKVLEGELELTKLKAQEAANELKNIEDSGEQGSGKTQKSIQGIRASFAGVISAIDKTRGGFSKVGSAVKSAFGKINSHVKKSSGLLKTMGSRMKSMLLSMLVFNWISKGWNTLISDMKEGFQNLAKYSSEYNKSISSLKSANAELKNNLASAFAPIIQMAIPYLVKLIDWLNTAANAIAKFFAALQGKSTYTKAVKQNINYAASLKDVGDSAKKSAGALASFDDLDVLNKDDNSGSGSTGGESTGAAAFEEAQIDENSFKWVEWLKVHLDEILTVAEMIGAAILAWKITSLFTEDLTKLAAAAMFAAGCVLLIKSAFDAWNNGVDWGNLIGMLSGVLLIVGALYLAFGSTAAIIGAAVGAIALLVVGIHDIIKNGVNLKNGIMVVAGVFMGLLATVGTVAAAIGAAIAALVLAVAADWENFKRTVWEPLKKFGQELWKNFTQIGNGIKTFLDGLVDFIAGVFTLDWKRAWNGVKKIFVGVWNAVVGILKAAVNLIIGILNTMYNTVVGVINAVIAAINRIDITIPDWVPVFGGKGFKPNIPTITPVNIPYLAHGGITTGSTLANIGEAGREAVLPLENNTGWMDDLADKLAARMPNYSTPTQIVMTLDGKEFARGELPYFNAESARIVFIELCCRMHQSNLNFMGIFPALRMKWKRCSRLERSIRNFLGK